MGGCLSCRLKFVHDHIPNDDTLPQNVTRFSYKSLKKATYNFSNSLGKNKHSSSYNGTLDDGSRVIVKEYIADVPINTYVDFTSMVKIMSGVKHQNVVELIGYCIEGHRKMLVHEFVGDYTLAQLLFFNSRFGGHVLDWPKRVSICHGITRALEYLHIGISPRVVHRNFKPSNVFLDSCFNPKIVGFELSRLIEDGDSDLSDNCVGTFGYLDPEYLWSSRYSEKIDVYAYGIIVLEIISGMPNNKNMHDPHVRTSMVEWAWELRENGRIPEIVDPTLTEFSEDEVIRFVNVALSCVQCCSSVCFCFTKTSDFRPSMSEVRLMLSDNYDFSNVVITRPGHCRQSRVEEQPNHSSDYEE